MTFEVEYKRVLEKKKNEFALNSGGVMDQQLGSADTVITQRQHFLLLHVKVMCRFEWKNNNRKNSLWLCKISCFC